MTDAAHNAALFTPVKLGTMTLPNRIAMAPLTRSRAGEGDTVRDMHVTYYTQRASAGLIITEASQISPQGKGYAWTPGIYSPAQVAAWRKVTDAVHKAGGHIVIQLWHVGRISHPELQPGKQLPVAPSAILPAGKAFIESGFVPFVEPRALEASEIPGIVEDYRKATRNALEAGFDGVEIHGANGYLIDQFLKSGTNHRTDAYGGSVENRTRFLREVAEAVVKEAGGAKVGIRFSPVSGANDARDDDPATTFGRAVEIVNDLGLAYIHIVEGQTGGKREPEFDYGALKRLFRGVYMANNGLDGASAASAVAEGRADMVAFGRPFISNPDLVERLKNGWELAQPDRTTFYGGDERGYTDYPTYEKAGVAAPAE